NPSSRVVQSDIIYSMKLHIEETIPKPIAEVYDAIVDPKKLVNHFVNATSGELQEKKSVRWSFGEGGEVDVRVTKLIPNALIELSWAATGLTTEVEIRVEEIGHNLTKIRITEGEWKLDKDSFAVGVEQTHGWTGFLDGLRAYLLFNINLREGKKVS
ncbi:MAG: SRPBCC domain-containing protein, partial [Candidatus Dojkabacteria bacterium]